MEAPALHTARLQSATRDATEVNSAKPSTHACLDRVANLISSRRHAFARATDGLQTVTACHHPSSSSTTSACLVAYVCRLITLLPYEPISCLRFCVATLLRSSCCQTGRPSDMTMPSRGFKRPYGEHASAAPFSNSPMFVQYDRSDPMHFYSHEPRL